MNVFEIKLAMIPTVKFMEENPFRFFNILKFSFFLCLIRAVCQYYDYVFAGYGPVFIKSMGRDEKKIPIAATWTW